MIYTSGLQSDRTNKSALNKAADMVWELHFYPTYADTLAIPMFDCFRKPNFKEILSLQVRL